MRWSEEEYEEYLKRPCQKIIDEKKRTCTNRQLEFQLQKQVASWLKYQYPNLLWTASAGGMRTSVGTGKKMKLMGYRRGCPDIMIFQANDKYYGLHIELKIKGGTQTPEQEQWQVQVEKNNYKYALVYSYEDAQEIINNYLLV